MSEQPLSTELPVQITNVVLMILEQVPDSGETTNVSLRGRGGRGGRGGSGVSSMPTTVHVSTYKQRTYSVHTAYIQHTYSVHTCTVFFDRTELPVQITIVVLMILDKYLIRAKVSFRGRGVSKSNMVLSSPRCWSAFLLFEEHLKWYKGITFGTSVCISPFSKVM